MAMEREQAERDQRRNLGVDGWTAVPPAQQQPLDESFHPEAFVNVGNFLNSQGQGHSPGQGRELRLVETNNTASQTASVTAASASTLTAPPLPPAPPGASHRRVVFCLLAFVVMLLGTNAYSYQQKRAWEAENASLRAEISKLEKARASAGPLDTFTTPTSCPGSQLIDTCWFKVGWGECTNDVLEDPVKPLEDAVRFAWDSTAEIIGAVTDTVANDLRQVCDAMHSFGRFIFEL